MTSRFTRLWNGKPLGLFFVVLSLLSVLVNRLSAVILSFSVSKGIGKCGHRVLIQKGFVARWPNNIYLGNNVSIGPSCSMTSELSDSKLVIGDFTAIDKRCHLDFSGGLTIGNNCTLSEGVFIQTHSHGIDPKSHPIKCPLDISDDVWVGAHAVILSQVSRIGVGAVIGACAVVTRDVADYEIVVGNPARVVGLCQK